MKEQYIDLTTSLVKDIGQNTKPSSSDLKDATRYVTQKWGGGGGGGEGATCHLCTYVYMCALSLLTSRQRRPNKVKFAANVTEMNSSERQPSKQQPSSSSSSSSSPLHTSQAQSTKDSSSNATAANGSDSRSHPSEPSHSKKS